MCGGGIATRLQGVDVRDQDDVEQLVAAVRAEVPRRRALV